MVSGNKYHILLLYTSVNQVLTETEMRNKIRHFYESKPIKSFWSQSLLGNKSFNLEL